LPERRRTVSRDCLTQVRVHVRERDEPALERLLVQHGLGTNCHLEMVICEDDVGPDHLMVVGPRSFGSPAGFAGFSTESSIRLRGAETRDQIREPDAEGYGCGHERAWGAGGSGAR